MSLPVAAALVGGTAFAAYLNAKFHIRNDLEAASASGSANLRRYVAEKVGQGKLSMYSIFEDRAYTSSGKNLFLEFEGQQWTYQEFYEQVQPVGNWLINELDIQQGEMVALNGPNSPEWLKIWLALEAIGAKPAFINYNLSGKSLIHCVQLCEPRYVLTDTALRQLVEPSKPDLLLKNIKFAYFDASSIASLIDHTPLPASRRSNISPSAISSLTFTSGTTGLPKGAVRTYARGVGAVYNLGQNLKLKSTDKMYTCLPLYHVSGLILCTQLCIGSGAAVVLSRKFSHRTFWPEVRASKATVIQYIAELPRYLLNAPPSPLDQSHHVAMAWGNGMRPDVWEPFRQRFNIPCIHELYGASDGLSICFNKNYGPFGRNAITVRGVLWDILNGQDEKRVRINPDTQDVIRDPITGFCIACRKGEAGEVVTRVDPANPNERFSGYLNNPSATQKRFIHDVFAKGDMWFRAGDMVRQDADGRVYFVDRLGDTFRWRSENVSTGEVEEVMSQFPSIQEVTVYGVLVPNADGRAGCAAIMLMGATESFDFAGLAEHALKSLPRYAVPLFVRIVDTFEMTGTMKVQKGTLKAEGIELEKIKVAANEKRKAADAMYYLPPGKKVYVPFKEKDLLEIRAGKVKL